MPAYRPRHAVAGGLLLAASVAAAEPADIERCAAAATLEARVECLEDTVRRLSGAAAAPTTPPADEPAAAAAPPAAPQPVAPPPAAPVQDASPPTSAAAPVAVAEARPELDRLGEEQVARRQERRDEGDGERLAAQVVAFDFVGRNKLRVTLENGQVWVQNKSDRPNLYPRLRNLDGFDVEMWRTSQGSYRMFVPEANRTIRIERLQ